MPVKQPRVRDRGNDDDKICFNSSIVPKYARRSRSLDALLPAFFKTLKAELIWRHQWPTRRACEIAIFQYINGFYNPRRKYSALNWKNPLAFERKAA